MIIIIIAGGSGTRLWPLSTSDYPKHLLTLVGERSMLQATYDRAQGIGDTLYVMTEAGHADHVRKQLPELEADRFIIEPGRRGTANCIVMALDVIARRHSTDEPIAFIHADHQVRDVIEFKRSFTIASKVATEQGRITLIGIEPTFPATGFGYIKRGEAIDERSGVYGVDSFKEKPDFALAKQYINDGNYFWNCGYFVGSVTSFLSAMKAHAPALFETYETLHRIPDEASYGWTYLALDNEVIDTALIEKVPDLAVVAAGFDWMDIGSFKDLHEANVSDENGNHFRGDLIYDDEVGNSYIRNEGDTPVVVIGLDNIVVINSPNGLLIARKDASQRVKDAVANIQKDREEHPKNS